jgi:hypothetical protein
LNSKNEDGLTETTLFLPSFLLVQPTGSVVARSGGGNENQTSVATGRASGGARSSERKVRTASKSEPLQRERPPQTNIDFFFFQSAVSTVARGGVSIMPNNNNNNNDDANANESSLNNVGAAKATWASPEPKRWPNMKIDDKEDAKMNNLQQRLYDGPTLPLVVKHTKTDECRKATTNSSSEGGKLSGEKRKPKEGPPSSSKKSRSSEKNEAAAPVVSESQEAILVLQAETIRLATETLQAELDSIAAYKGKTCTVADLTKVYHAVDNKAFGLLTQGKGKQEFGQDEIKFEEKELLFKNLLQKHRFGGTDDEIPLLSIAHAAVYLFQEYLGRCMATLVRSEKLCHVHVNRMNVVRMWVHQLVSLYYEMTAQKRKSDNRSSAKKAKKVSAQKPSESSFKGCGSAFGALQQGSDSESSTEPSLREDGDSDDNDEKPTPRVLFDDAVEQ